MARSKKPKINFSEKLSRAGGLTAGAVAGGLLKAQVADRFFPQVDSRFVNGGIAILGFFLPEVAPKKKGSEVLAAGLSGLGDGMYVQGTSALINSMIPQVSGIGAAPLMEDFVGNPYNEQVMERAVSGNEVGHILKKNIG